MRQRRDETPLDERKLWKAPSHQVPSAPSTPAAPSSWPSRLKDVEFPLARRGYDMRSVDEYLEAVNGHLDRLRRGDAEPGERDPTAGEMTPHVIERRVFATARRGYDPDHVRSYLGTLAQRVRATAGPSARQDPEPADRAMSETSFTVVRRGYDPDQVYGFITRVERAIEGLRAGEVVAQPLRDPLTAETVRVREFATVRRGLDPDLVRYHLRRLADRLTELERASPSERPS